METSWVMEQVNARAPGPDLGALHELVEALMAVRGDVTMPLFGAPVDQLEVADFPVVAQALVAQLVKWKQFFRAQGNAVKELLLHHVATELGKLEELKLTDFAPRGSREGLSAQWLSILSRLDEVNDGPRHLKLGAPSYGLGEPDALELFEAAAMYEAATGAAFPRELAAFYATVDGVFVGDEPFLASVAQWSEEADGIRIGEAVKLVGSRTDLLNAKVVSGEREFENFAAFADALLGK
ncbi:MAG: hypothetical protein DI536_13225 [Archangium gephyra]|uniref:Uncharacterized protein n=1 Tax=Archangium gephyra TaxID=48 RepID=A0A2W5TEP7_9BACT|nr:MAG: hypothetical protein DI536_13225 [Archangium gephyra]